MRKLATSVFMVAVGFTVAPRLSMAQGDGRLEDTVRQVVSALGSNDRPALNKLSIDQAEFKKYVWPMLAAGMTGVGVDKYYPTYQKVSDASIAEGNATLAGKKLKVVKVSLGPPQRKGNGFQVFGPPLITLSDESGQEQTVRLVGGLLENGGVYKVTTYYVSPFQMAGK